MLLLEWLREECSHSAQGLTVERRAVLEQCWHVASKEPDPAALELRGQPLVEGGGTGSVSIMLLEWLRKHWSHPAQQTW